MFTGLLRALTLFALLTPMLGCSNDARNESQGRSLADYLADTFGLYVSGYDEVDDTFEEDGVLITEGTGYTWVEGEAAREMHVRLEQFSAAEGGDLVLRVTDIESGDARDFLYN